MAADTSQPRACKCLNVRITPAAEQPTSTPARPATDSIYTPVHVKDDGIVVAHPQVTVRLASKPEPVPGTTKHSRFTTLTCLLCDLAVYRVYHEVSLDVEGNDAPLFPSESWVEQGVMKSPDGWIEVHKDCIVGDKILEAESSATYNASFSLLLPPPVSPLPKPTELTQEDEEAILPKTQSSEEPPRDYLSHLRPLFLPPPFTPSHPVFHHLSSIANNDSQALREAAEQRIADFVKSQAAEVQEKEKKLKENVETLWKHFKHNLDSAQAERARIAPQSVARSFTHGPNGVVSPAPVSASLKITTFVPEQVSLPAQHKPVTPRYSALSASLATSTFHHPSYRSESRASSGASTPSPSTAQSVSSTLVNPNNRGNGSNVLQFSRTVDDNINTQASYRYFLNLEEEMERHKRKRAEEMKKQQAEVAKTQAQNGGSTTPKDSKPKSSKKSDPSKAEGSQSKGSEARDAASSRGRDKGKRKVTFDVKPAVSGTNEVDDEQVEESDDDDAMMFPLSDMDDDDQAPKTNRPRQTLPLLEAPPSRPLRERRINSGIETFKALRPSSLPAPSHMRPIRSQPGVDASSSRLVIKKPAKRVSHTPSHRGSWQPDSKAWQTFARRRETQDSDEEQDVIPEEGEDEATTTKPTNIMGSKRGFTTYQMTPAEGIPKSLPVTIRMRHLAKEPLSLSSYRAPAMAGDGVEHVAEEPSGTGSYPGGSEGKKPMSSAQIRRALYAERDRARAIDPGYADFVSEPEEGELEEEDQQEDESAKSEKSEKSDDGGEKARKHALKILQARSEIPTESMWRSLA